MKQVLVKKGKILAENIAAPKVQKDWVLVKTSYSCISAGTEMSSVKSSGSSLFQMAKEHPEYVKMGLEMLANKGVKATWDTVMGNNSLGSALGYSASGIVVESGTKEFAKGDRVACMGAGYANHAGYIAVPKNLVVRIPEAVSMEDASTAALGCIAMQGVRRAEVQLGEYVVICGMGILGQLACRFAVLSGATVIVTDVDERRLQIAQSGGASYTINVKKDDVVKRVMDITGNHGADKVILTAATDSNELISQGFKMCRKRGTVVLVGVAGMNLKREDMYAKELEFKIATSYGPGRYDENYEAGGIDYPYGFVRFTEQRNLESYLRLLAEKRIELATIIEGIYPVEDAEKAYDDLKNADNKPLILLLKYNEGEIDNKVVVNREYKMPEGVIKVAICGVGGFAKGMHLPNLEKMKDKYSIYAIQTRTGTNAQAVAKQYGAKYATTDYDEILNDPNVDMVMICTRHNLHAEMTIKALKAGKAVFVEKPMALTVEETQQVMETIQETGMPYMVGFNRRFSKYAREVKNHIEKRQNPLMIYYRMNAGFLPKEHWTQGPEGGGRIIGEGCHIIDLFNYFTDSKAESVSINQITPHNDKVMGEDNCVITIKYEDGSVCTLLYTGQGNSGISKEYCEIYCDGTVITIDDYKEINGYGTKVQNLKSAVSEKGQKEELEEFYKFIKNGKKYPIELWQLEQTSQISYISEY